MDDKQRAEIKDLLKKEIEKTKRYIEDYKSMTEPSAPDAAIGRVSRMDAINNKSITEAALRSAEEKWSGLQYALTKVDEENFGQCARCGNNIPIQRIILRPQSVHCVNCAH